MRWGALLCVVVLVGCSESQPQHRVLTFAERHERAQTELARTPQPQVYRIEHNQLIVLDVPTESMIGLVEKHHCFVWRDAEYQTATMTCPGEPSITTYDVDAQ